jgi:hypothetical protein
MECIKYKGKKYKTGDSVIFKINNNIVRGKLYIEYSSEKYSTAYICHNNDNFDGSGSPNKLGHKYSWRFTVYNTRENIFEGSDVEIIYQDIDTASKENIKVSKKLQKCLEIQEIQFIHYFFERETIFKQYNKIKISDKTGYVKLTDTTKNRSMDIKFGRFLTSLLKQVKDLHNIDIVFTNKDVEKFYNFFTSYQNNTHIEVLELKGDDIVEGYKSENYLFKKSSLGESCMNDKLENIKLYTLNPNVVSLLVIKLLGKIVGRCLIWNTNKGKVMDKRYTCFDWVNSKFETILKENNYICQSSLENKKIDIQLDNISVYKYPYVDTFKLFNLENALLTNNYNENKVKETYEQRLEFIKLTTTTGDYYYYNKEGDILCSNT